MPEDPKKKRGFWEPIGNYAGKSLSAHASNLGRAAGGIKAGVQAVGEGIGSAADDFVAGYRAGAGLPPITDTPAGPQPSPKVAATSTTDVKPAPPVPATLDSLAQDVLPPSGTPHSYQVKDSTEDATLPEPLAGVPRYSEKINALLAEPRDLTSPRTLISSTRSGIGPWSSEKLESLSGLENSLARRDWLENRQLQEQGRELAEAGFNQSMEGARVNPLAAAEAENQLKVGQGKLAGAQAGLFTEQAKLAGRTPQVKAYSESMLPLREYVTAPENWDGKGYGAMIENKAAQMAVEKYGPKVLQSKNARAIISGFQEAALTAFIIEMQPALQRSMMGVMGSPYMPGTGGYGTGI